MLMDVLNKVATTALLGFVVSSMMAMGVGFTVRQIIDALRNLRLVLLALLAKFCSDPARRPRFGQNAQAPMSRWGWACCCLARLRLFDPAFYDFRGASD
jgi:hypothetical protein